MAVTEGLKVSGLLALLIQAKEMGIIKRVRPLMEELKKNGFFISEELYKDTLQKTGE